MDSLKNPILSIVVPLYNEASGLRVFHADLLGQVHGIVKESYEIMYVDDGSTDETADIVHEWHDRNPRVKLVRLSRNFGKENALTAGIAAARGRAIITLDGDGQHPVELLPEFFAAWRKGAQVVVGIRTNPSGTGWAKTFAPRLFYRLLGKLSEQEVIRGGSDFRLIDRSVQIAFLNLKEGNRLTRGLIDWLGFKRELVPFEAKERETDSAGYSRAKLINLAANSFVSLSPKPLYWFGYLGVLITIAALLLGVAVIVEQLLLGDPWHWRFTGTAMLGILILFLVGIVLMSQGILSLYISHIHNESKGRPLYIIDYDESAGIGRNT